MSRDARSPAERSPEPRRGVQMSDDDEPPGPPAASHPAIQASPSLRNFLNVLMSRFFFSSRNIQGLIFENRVRSTRGGLIYCLLIYSYFVFLFHFYRGNSNEGSQGRGYFTARRQRFQRAL